jgi:glycopeptide antibiotics resistance protein
MKTFTEGGGGVQLVAHGDYYSVVSYRTFSVISGGVLEIFAVFNNFYVFVPLCLVLRNPGWETLLYSSEV